MDEEFQTVPYFHAKYKVEEIPAHYIDRWQNKDIEDPSLSLPPLNEFMPSLFFEEIKLISLRDEDDVDGDTCFDICLNEVSSKLFHREDRSALLSNTSFNLYINVSDIKAHMRALIIIEMIKDDLSAILFKNIMDKMQREFTSWDIVQQASTLLSDVLIDGNITLDNKFKVLQSITFEDVKHFNFLSEVFFQMSCKEDDSGRETTFLVILKATIEVYLYRELRQKERLGYEIGCGVHLNSGMRGFFVYVVSTIRQPKYLLERIYAFIGTVGEFLEGVDESGFESYNFNSDSWHGTRWRKSFMATMSPFHDDVLLLGSYASQMILLFFKTSAGLEGFQCSKCDKFIKSKDEKHFRIIETPEMVKLEMDHHRDYFNLQSLYSNLLFDESSEETQLACVQVIRRILGHTAPIFWLTSRPNVVRNFAEAVLGVETEQLVRKMVHVVLPKLLVYWQENAQAANTLIELAKLLDTDVVPLIVNYMAHGKILWYL
ncbi:unnamed protein product [Arabidopsis arenosa]|uniref:Uncharacterized protein n=1 Tax=Arabidopsis arenosa TaxID=38785 RepID=A0A8S1ZV22_ARAAE|nr:unnamed protein product [Arabidopsis arenosa]